MSGEEELKKAAEEKDLTAAENEDGKTVPDEETRRPPEETDEGIWEQTGEYTNDGEEEIASFDDEDNYDESYTAENIPPPDETFEEWGPDTENGNEHGYEESAVYPEDAGEAADPALADMEDENREDELSADIPPESENAPPPSAKKSYADIEKKRINRGQRFERNRTMIVILSIIGCLMLVFILGTKIKKRDKKTTDIGKAGKIYIPDMIRREPSASSETPPEEIYTYDLSDEELLENLPFEEEDTHAAPVRQEYAAPTTNRNPLQKSVSRMPWNGQSAAAARVPSLPMGPEEYLAQLQQRGNQLAGMVPGTVSGPAAMETQSGYAAQNMQTAKERFASTGTGSAGNYQWNSGYALFKGTIIPAVLETGINSDLPGAIIARVTRNVYSSLDGKYLLIPEGSRLYAMYNSNISYSQKRVQIAWTTLIRPDGLEISLGNMQGVDVRGYTGQKGFVNDHFFEYLKAMGIISVFSIANGELDNSLKEMDSSSYADQLVSENRNVINRLAGKLIDRALDIQPTIRVKQGTEVNVLTNVTLELPPLEPYPVTSPYRR
jgi:type IV secretion system protein VirB10